MKIFQLLRTFDKVHGKSSILEFSKTILKSLTKRICPLTIVKTEEQKMEDTEQFFQWRSASFKSYSIFCTEVSVFNVTIYSGW